MNFGTGFGLVFLFYAAFTLVGFLSVRLGNVRAARMAVLTWNARISKLNMSPFSGLIEALAHKDYGKIAVWSVLLNAWTVLLQFILGVLMLAPFMAGFAGMSVGYLFGVADRATLLPNVPARIMEYGAFAAAGAGGLLVGVEWIFGGSGLERALLTLTPALYRIFGLTFLLLTLGGLVEASLVRRGIGSIPPLDAIREKKYLKQS